MRSIVYIIAIIVICMMFGAIVDGRAQDVVYDSVTLDNYAPVQNRNDTFLRLFLRPIALDSTTSLHYQMWYSTDSVVYSIMDIGEYDVPGRWGTAYNDMLYLFLWIGDSERLNLTYK